MLEGDIQVGDRLLWDYTVIGGSERVVVKEIAHDFEGCSILLSGIHGNFWSSERRLREMCIREE